MATMKCILPLSLFVVVSAGSYFNTDKLTYKVFPNAACSKGQEVDQEASWPEGAMDSPCVAMELKPPSEGSEHYMEQKVPVFTMSAFAGGMQLVCGDDKKLRMKTYTDNQCSSSGTVQVPLTIDGMAKCISAPAASTGWRGDWSFWFINVPDCEPAPAVEPPSGDTSDATRTGLMSRSIGLAILFALGLQVA